MRSPNFSNLEALALIAAGIVMFGSAQVQAGSSNKNGNPYGNGTFFNNSGTYTAIMRGQNLMGVSQFSIFADGLYPSSGWNMLNGASSNNVQPGQTNPGSGTPGFVSLYYNGSSYNGPAFSVVDPGGAQIGSVFYTYKAGGALWNPGGTNFYTKTTNIPLTNITTLVTTNSNPVISAYTNTNSVITTFLTTNSADTFTYSTNYTYQITNALVTNPSLTNLVTNADGSVNELVIPSTNIITVTNIIINTITNTNTVTEIVVNAYTNTNSRISFQTNFDISVSTTFVTNIVSTNLIATNSIPSGGGYNYYDGYWNASLQNKYPNQVFYGNGAVSLGQSGDPTDPSPINHANGTANVRQVPFSVQGTRVSGSTSQIY